MPDLTAALEAWTQALGAEHVVTDPDRLALAATATFATTQRIPAILRPGTRAELRECVLIADRFRVPLYPVSSGLNWGYGSAVPPKDGCVQVQLARLDRIVAFDEELAYVTVEPGVTQHQLYQFLLGKGTKLRMSVTGGSPHGSLIGNTIERGTALTYYWNRFAHVCALEVLLPTGEVVHTGFDRFPGAATAKLDRWGVGPALQDLFSQSSFGIVTEMTFWLLPPPAVHQTFHFALPGDDASGLERVTEALRSLTLGHPLRVGIGLFNDYNFLILVQKQYPWDESGGAVPLQGELRRKLRAQYRIAAWNGNGALYSASPAHARADRRLVKKALRGAVSRLFFLHPTNMRLLRAIRTPYRWVTKIDLGGLLDDLTVKNPDLGVPGGPRITLPYWRKRQPPPAETHPERDRCGVLWCSPVVPYAGRHVRAAAEIIEEVSLAHGFEPSVGMRGSRERTIDMVVGLMYDRDTPGEDERAMACHDELLTRLIAQGYLPERLGIQSMALLPPPRDDSAAVLSRLKSAFDPHGILAPGRYLP